MDDGRVVLRAGALRVEVAPRVGGGIARFDRIDAAGGGRVALFRGADGACDDALAAGCFPLVPYANRIRGGRFACNGRTVALAPNMAGDASPLHGQGWRGEWRLCAPARESALELAFEHVAGEWPWHYEARQRIELDAGG